MLAEQRLSQILEIIKQNDFAEVEELALLLNVSTMTIRRDLQKLDDRGLVQRRHGGAAALSIMKNEQSYSDKKASNLREKESIANAAEEFVKDGDSIYLDGGTTVLHTARKLKSKKNLTVVTSDLMTALELSETDIELILIGGRLQAATKTTGGVLAVEMLKKLRLTTAFIGTSSVNRDFDLFTPTPEKSCLKRTAMEISQRCYLLADSGKFFSQSLHCWGAMSDFTGVITDRVFSAAEKKLIKQKKIAVISSL